ncbi:MAG TPA: TlpA disulfide reductase family protein [Chloroflexota bacterium]|nr:TlpA disulfide reductase family protein [Chloroflexota bacterium]
MALIETAQETTNSQVGAASSAPPGPVTRAALLGLTIAALAIFAVYAAILASRAEEVIEPVPIAVPSKGATTPYGIGQYAADFTVTDLEGRPVKLSDYAGRPVWINVWASWCAPCRAEMPDIDSVYREVKAAEAQRGLTNGGLAILLVSLGEDPAIVRQYVGRTKYDLPVVVDPDFAITEHYRITGLPTHYFIDGEGVIRDLAIGGLKPNGMRSKIAKITGLKPA